MCAPDVRVEPGEVIVPIDHLARWEQIDVGTHANPDAVIKGQCRHLTPVPVHAAGTGDLVAYLCPDCDTQLPAE